MTFTGPALHTPYTFQTVIGQIMGKDATDLALPIDHGVPAGAYMVSIQIAYRAGVLETKSPSTLRSAWTGTVTVR